MFVVVVDGGGIGGDFIYICDHISIFAGIGFFIQLRCLMKCLYVCHFICMGCDLYGIVLFFFNLMDF